MRGVLVSTLLFVAACGGNVEYDTGAGGDGGSAGSAADGGVAGSSGSGATGFGGAGGVSGSSGSGGTIASGGTGALPGSGGAAGVGGIPSCVPGASAACACVDGAPGSQVCRSDGTFGACICGSRTLTWYAEAMLGDWRGTRTTVWDGTHSVDVSFREDGTWVAGCADDCLVFYWGGVESVGNPYRLTAVTDAGEATGQLTVRWGIGTTQQGTLRHVWLDDARNQLTFEFWNTWSGEIGPLAFTLRRQ